MKLHMAILLTDEDVDSKYVEVLDGEDTYVVRLATIEFDAHIKEKISDMVDHLYKFAGAGISMKDFVDEMLDRDTTR